jgi:hypothetical protein
MGRTGVAQSHIPTISQMMDLAERQEPVWTSEDLAAMLRHQLSVSLLDGLGKVLPQPELRHRCKKLEAGMTFGELFSDPAPPLRLLALGKQLAKQCRGGKHHGSLPRDLCLVLYYAAIVAARVRCGQRISELPDAALRRGLGWATEQQWVDKPLGALLSEGLARIHGDG